MSERIPPEELAAMRKRCEKATDGPWFYWDHADNDVIATGQNRGKLICALAGIESRPHDFNFIARARTDLPHLLDAYESLLEALSDPAAVWANMLRGTIARPQALDHYEQCKNELEALQRDIAEKWATGDCSAHQVPNPDCAQCNPTEGIEALQARLEAVIGASIDLHEWIMDHPDKILDIEDSVYLPWTKAINGGEGERDTLRAENERLKALLKRCEWSAHSINRTPLCPLCGRGKDWPHATSCELKKAIE